MLFKVLKLDGNLVKKQLTMIESMKCSRILLYHYFVTRLDLRLTNMILYQLIGFQQ